MDACHAADSDRELAFLRAVIDHAHAGILATDATGAIVLNKVLPEYFVDRGATGVARALAKDPESVAEQIIDQVGGSLSDGADVAMVALSPARPGG